MNAEPIDAWAAQTAQISAVVALASNRLVNVAELAEFFGLRPAAVMQILKNHA